MEKVSAIVAGGQTRQESVAIGLFALGGDPDDLVLVHDAARPLVSAAVIDRCLAGAQEHGSAVAALPVTDTLKAAGDDQIVQRTVDREGLWAMQTPQAFRLSVLYEAHSAARAYGWTGTDEAALVEQFSDSPVHLVLGDAANFKDYPPGRSASGGSRLAVPAARPVPLGLFYDHPYRLRLRHSSTH